MKSVPERGFAQKVLKQREATGLTPKELANSSPGLLQPWVEIHPNVVATLKELRANVRERNPFRVFVQPPSNFFPRVAKAQP